MWYRILTMLLSLILFSVYRNVFSGSVQTSVTLTPVSNSVNALLVSHTHETDTVLSCVRLCLNIRSASFHYEAGNKTCYCYTEVDTTVVPGTYTDALYGYPTSSRIENNDGSYMIRTYPESTDCLDLYEQGFRVDGMYEICPVGGANIKVWCNQEAGGWTVIQSRMDGSEGFYRGWQDYAQGFGNVLGEYWLGLENIRLLTEISSSLRVRMRTFGDNERTSGFALYKTFGLHSGPIHYYSLIIGNFTGDCGDSLSYHDGAPFTTYDEDHDENESGNCAISGQAGWWFKLCYHSNLNGPYHQQGVIVHPTQRGVTWVTGWTHDYSLQEVVMEIRRN